MKHIFSFWKGMRSALLFCVALALLPLAGCSAETPLPVSAAALSRTGEGYQMTAELIRQDSLDGDATPVYLVAEGADLPALFEDADRKMGGRFYFSHAETVILDEALAAEGIAEVAAYLVERPDARLTLRLVIARDADAEELLQLDALGENIPGVALSELLNHLAEAEKIPDQPLYRVQNALNAGEELLLPCLRETNDGHAAAEGLAVLRGGALLRYLPEEGS